MTSLPLRVPERLREIPDIVGTYDICLGIEKALQLAIDKGDDVGNNQIYIRILGYLIHYVPTDQGLRNIVEEISSCVDDSAILDVGKKYYDHYIWAFRANKGRIWTPFSDETPVSFDTITEMTTHTFVEAPQSHDGAKKNALIRDGYRCVVTKKYDSSLVGKVRELQDLFVSEGPDSPSADRTQCTHIFSESTNLNVPPSSETLDYAASMWSVMKCFGYDSLPEELNSPNVHRLENVMTLVPGLRVEFDRLGLWFVATGNLNEYKLEAAKRWTLFNYPKSVTFTTPDQDKLPVPSPDYLAIHAACAKVAHLSGAAECIDKLYEDMDDSETLAPDGTSASMLEHAIFELQACGWETVI